MRKCRIISGEQAYEEQVRMVEEEEMEQELSRLLEKHNLENDEESEYWYTVNEYEKSGTVKKK